MLTLKFTVHRVWMTLKKSLHRLFPFTQPSMCTISCTKHRIDATSFLIKAAILLQKDFIGPTEFTSCLLRAQMNDYLRNYQMLLEWFAHLYVPNKTASDSQNNMTFAVWCYVRNITNIWFRCGRDQESPEWMSHLLFLLCSCNNSWGH